MPRTIDEIRREACYNSEAQARTKPLLTGEKCECSNQEGCFKFPPPDLSQYTAGRLAEPKKNIWPQCNDCGENHPSPTDDLLNKDVMERAKKAKKKPVLQKTTVKGTCQWPNPCQADCFEDHGRNMRKKEDCKDTTCIEKICSNLKTTSCGALPTA